MAYITFMVLWRLDPEVLTLFDVVQLLTSKVLVITILGISSGSRTAHTPFQHKRGDPFTNAVCSSVCFLYLIASIGGMSFLLNNVFHHDWFCVITRNMLLQSLAMFYETGYSSWWLWWPCGCYLTVWKPFVHIPLSIFIVLSASGRIDDKRLFFAISLIFSLRRIYKYTALLFHLIVTSMWLRSTMRDFFRKKKKIPKW